jgi:ABC-type sugar transport system ATPase subunit
VRLPRPPGLADGPLVLGIRPGEVRVGHGVALPVRRLERLGHETQVELELAGAPFLVTLPGHGPAGEPAQLAVELPGHALHLFAAESGLRLARV